MGDTIKRLLQNSEELSSLPKVVVFGVGGGGCNTIDYIYKKQIKGVDTILANTDVKSIMDREADKKIQIGKNLTKGYGAGSNPEIGKMAAEESEDEIKNALKGTQLLFITTGMGGGTGTGAAPVIAKIAKQLDILTIAVLTKPFDYEADMKKKYAEEGIKEMNKYTNAMIILPNDNLLRIANRDTLLLNAFSISNDVLYLGVRGISDLITLPGLITLDFADIKAVLEKSGRAMIGTGESDDAEDRAMLAVDQALSNPLLEDVNIANATGLLVNITGGHDLTLHECQESMKKIKDRTDCKNIHMKMGTTISSDMDGKVRVSIFATGITDNSDKIQVQTPIKQSEILKQEFPKQQIDNDVKNTFATLNTKNNISVENNLQENKGLITTTLHQNNTNNTKSRLFGGFDDLFSSKDNKVEFEIKSDFSGVI